MAPADIRAQCERRLATDPRDSVREHYFALMGQHRRLLPPGAITLDGFPPEALVDVLRAGVTDVVPAVRERAIAAAYGLGKVKLVRDEVLACLAHAHEGVRQYAIVALGLLDDAETLARLVALLERGSQAEATSAIWALARRPDGLARALTLVTDTRPWVRFELLHAIADAAAPMTDAQIAATTAAMAADDRVPRAIDHHLERTRRGGREYGPDGGVFVVRSQGNS